MKLTLLELVEDALTAIDSENVTDVGETPEAGMVVNIANRCFEDMIARHRWVHQRRYDTLESSSNLNELGLPAGTIAFDPDSIWYEDSNGNSSRVYYTSPEIFIARTIGRDTSESTIQAVNGIKVVNDRVPTFYTSDDDQILRFEAMPSSVSGLDAADTDVLLWLGPTTRLSANAEEFDLPYSAFPALSDYIIATSLSELKGDTQLGEAKLREFKSKMGRLKRNARIIDVRPDLRNVIVPRISYLARVNPQPRVPSGYTL